jgi:tRNA A37 threonylcarbamoyladenosine dehydratase
VEEQYSRSEHLLGEGSTNILRQAHVAVFGLGGVGSYLVEALARMGVGELTLVDRDAYSESNLNRQLYATRSTVGRSKAEVAKERIAEIEPRTVVHTVSAFVLPENIGDYDFSSFDYVADAIDTVSAKLALAKAAHENGVPIISAMGAGGKLDPTAFRVADIAKTKVCPLARVMRSELRRMGIHHMKVVYSEEEPHKTNLTDEESGKPIPASCSFVPSVMGLIMAGEIIKDLLRA